MGAGAAAFGLLGTAMQAKGQLEQNDTQQSILKLNEQFADQAANDAVSRGNIAAARVRLQASKLEGQQRVAYAASGVDASTGTPLDAMADSRMMSELDAQTLRNNAAREAYGYKVKAFQDRAQGSIDTERTQYAVASSVLGGVSQAGSIAYPRKG